MHATYYDITIRGVRFKLFDRIKKTMQEMRLTSLGRGNEHALKISTPFILLVS
jgi:hypothetical protein